MFPWCFIFIDKKVGNHRIYLKNILLNLFEREGEGGFSLFPQNLSTAEIYNMGWMLLLRFVDQFQTAE